MRRGVGQPSLAPAVVQGLTFAVIMVAYVRELGLGRFNNFILLFKLRCAPETTLSQGEVHQRQRCVYYYCNLMNDGVLVSCYRVLVYLYISTSISKEWERKEILEAINAY